MAKGLSPEVVAYTRRFWEEQTGQPVSDEDAREAIRNISAFADLIASWEQTADAEPTEDETEEDDDRPSAPVS